MLTEQALVSFSRLFPLPTAPASLFRSTTSGCLTFPRRRQGRSLIHAPWQALFQHFLHLVVQLVGVLGLRPGYIFVVRIARRAQRFAQQVTVQRIVSWLREKKRRFQPRSCASRGISPGCTPPDPFLAGSAPPPPGRPGWPGRAARAVSYRGAPGRNPACDRRAGRGGSDTPVAVISGRASGHHRQCGLSPERPSLQDVVDLSADPNNVGTYLPDYSFS